MTFHSILFERNEDRIQEEPLEAPLFFGDLHLDQVIAALAEGKQAYQLPPLFFRPLKSTDAILYRQAVMRDLEDPLLFEVIQSFARNMRLMRERLAQSEKLSYMYQKKRWFLDAVAQYCETIQSLLHDLADAGPRSNGLLAFRDYLATYTRSERFTSLLAETKEVQAALSTIHYCLLIKGNSITVRVYKSEDDYSTEIANTFAKFRQGAVKDYRVKLADWPEMNHVEAHILDLVARLYPDAFSHLDDYCAKNSHYLDETIATFDREIQFYVAYLEYIARLKRKGLPFCYPRLSTTAKEVSLHEGFDLALATKCLAEGSPVVCNDCFLQGKERIMVVTGPNQGGKTTFARMFGQMHYLASLGCLVPGREARLFLCDHLFTHFEKEEDITTLRGKLQDDLVRINTILTQATAHSLIILNEIFTSTTVNDAVFLSKNVLEKMVQLDALGVCVTFLDELASFSEKIVSMVSTIVPDNPALRTYKIARSPADGLAYALAIAEKYRLTYKHVKERIPS
jgi:DNA mismatch repair protein MutS